jgi:hypothetical protein
MTENTNNAENSIMAVALVTTIDSRLVKNANDSVTNKKDLLHASKSKWKVHAKETSPDISMIKLMDNANHSLTVAAKAIKTISSMNKNVRLGAEERIVKEVSCLFNLPSIRLLH